MNGNLKLRYFRPLLRSRHPKISSVNQEVLISPRRGLDGFRGEQAERSERTGIKKGTTIRRKTDPRMPDRPNPGRTIEGNGQRILLRRFIGKQSISLSSWKRKNPIPEIDGKRERSIFSADRKRESSRFQHSEEKRKRRFQ